jgi:hypothetical protein
MRRLALGLVVLLAAAPALAQTASDTGVATELFNAGRDLIKAGNYAAACPKLADSARLDAKVGTLARLAECEEKLGQLVDARAYWQQALNLARVQHDERTAHVESELARVDGVVPKLKVDAKGSDAPGFALKVDDLQVGKGGLGIPLPVQPGNHTLVATATGKKPWSTTISTSANGAVTAVTIPALDDDIAAPVPPPKAPPPHVDTLPDRGSPWRTVGLVTAGVGVVGVGIGAVFGFLAKQKYDDSNAQPGGCDAQSNCPPSAAATRNDARTSGNVSTVLFIAGGALTAGGLAIWLLAPKAASSSASLAAAPVVGAQGAGLSIRGAF